MPMIDVTGMVTGLVKIFRDQTEQVRAKTALEKSLKETELARAQAEAANRAKDYFFAVLSHELRAPLTPVSMAAATLLRRGDLPPDVLEALGMIRRNVQLQSDFIEDLLDVTRIAQKKLEIDRNILRLHQVLQLAVEIAIPDINEKRQVISQTLADGDPVILGDSRRLQQVFWNLLKNASKFTPREGAINLRTRVERGFVIIEIIDTGIGIKPELIEKIFDAFEQGNTAATRKAGGLGLGLAISKAIVQAHGGTITAKSPGEGQGATFVIELPLDSSARPTNSTNEHLHAC